MAVALKSIILLLSFPVKGIRLFIRLPRHPSVGMGGEEIRGDQNLEQREWWREILLLIICNILLLTFKTRIMQLRITFQARHCFKETFLKFLAPPFI